MKLLLRDCTRLRAILIESIVFIISLQPTEAGASYLPGVAVSIIDTSIIDDANCGVSGGNIVAW
ncbi:hypothetical protein K4L44_08740 [Halosquirtibacter laminarini]|uniref:Uncharacterized protein n=1 Tax=Halosquirtibacter laminarini TaxID=3374600 RepID=A0AC61NPH9_9BACT|nr:hypothetical protein K4L44_08740 [Prolixibacteraceae bacterium]